MTEIDQLKMEARQLLEEVNHEFERTSGRNAKQFYDFESAFERSFKNKLRQLKQRLVSLKLASTSFSGL